MTPSTHPLIRRVGAPFAFVGVLAATVQYARPFFENQNQYFAHAVSFPQLQRDWLYNTTDPYPAFSMLAAWLVSLSHNWGPVIAAYLFNIIALSSVFLFARKMKGGRSENGERASYMAVTLVAATLITVPGGFWAFYYSLFNGLGGQYIISKPSYFQPSASGALLLLAFYLWLYEVERDRVRWAIFALAGLLTGAACVLHPTYLISSAIGLGLLAVLRFLIERRHRFLHYLLVGILILASIRFLNPAVFDIGRASALYETALGRFAYERISGHSLWREWQPINVVFPLVIGAGAWVAFRRYGDKLLALWLILSLVVCLISAFVMPLLPTPKFVLMFPWRISVCLVPIASAVLARSFADWLQSRLSIRAWQIGLVAVMLAAFGLTQTLMNWRSTDRDSAVSLLRAAQPDGVGIIPVKEHLIRLNVPIPVYVDWKSPPYASNDLISWWRRVDQVNALYSNPPQFCGAHFDQTIDWLLVPATAPSLPCAGEWLPAERSKDWRLYRRTPQVSIAPKRNEN